MCASENDVDFDFRSIYSNREISRTYQGGGALTRALISRRASMGQFRVLITTDNHLGIYERDSFDGRCDDSFEALEEVLDGGIERGADCVLMAGDLFEEKRPSAQTMVRAMQMFQQRCLGGETDVRVLENKGTPTNLEVGDARVRLPVFTIHGNHDVPYGAEGRGHSVLDELHQARVLNHIGNSTFRNDVLTIDPITIEKDGVQIALYGIGWIKDVSAQRAFAENRVEFGEPPAGAFCILLIHQNRSVYVRDRVDEQHIPPWFDLVVWGHEHECFPEPQAVPGKKFVVSQLGSTAQTKCSANEEAGKYALMLTIGGDGPRYEPFKLERVRPFVYREITLAAGEDAHERALSQVLEMAEARNASGKVPMVRLRVHYDSRETTLPAAFETKLGAELKGRVVNPDTAVLAYKKRPSKRRGSKDVQATTGNPMETERLEDFTFTIEGFIAKELRKVDSNVVPCSDLVCAIEGGEVFTGEKQVKANNWLEGVKDRDKEWSRGAGSIAPELKRDWRDVLFPGGESIKIDCSDIPDHWRRENLLTMKLYHERLKQLNVEGCCDHLVAQSAAEIEAYESGKRVTEITCDAFVDIEEEAAPKTPPVAQPPRRVNKRKRAATESLQDLDLDFLKDEEEVRRFMDFDFDRVDERLDAVALARNSHL